jgi:hypothetical protein
VLCESCGTIHVYRFEEAATESAPKLAARLQGHSEIMSLRGAAGMHHYDAAASFTDGDYLQHPVFGAGYVLGIEWPPSRMQVLFADRQRMLICGPGSVQQLPPAPEKPAPPLRPRLPKRTLRPDRGGRSYERPAPDLPTTPAGTVTCPICHRTVHSMNLAITSDNRVIGCMHCRTR